MPNPSNPQDLNRFSYVRNNPLRYTDPTGHVIACEPGDVCERTPLKLPPPLPQPKPKPKPEPNPDPAPDPNPDSLSPPLEPEEVEVLTGVQLVGQGFTFFLIEATLLFPIDVGLVELTGAGVGACLDGILLACVADIPLGALDVAVADFQISLASMIVQNVETGTKHDFEWTITPVLLSALPESAQQTIYNALPGLEPNK